MTTNKRGLSNREATGQLPFLSARRLVESGLLYEINRTVLWPLGLALSVYLDPDDPDDEGAISDILDAHEVIVPSGDELEQERAAAFVEFAAQRAALIYPEATMPDEIDDELAS